MKKILSILLCMMMISGCSSQKFVQTYMLKNSDDTYNLYSEKGKKLSDDNYSQYQKNSNNGYIVTLNDKQGYINDSGKELIEIGKYSLLQLKDEMIVAYQSEIQDEESINKVVAIYDSEGEELETIDEDTTYIDSDLPIVCMNDNYKVLYKDGEELYYGSDKVTSAGYIDEIYYVMLEKSMNFYKSNTDSTFEVKEAGHYVVKDAYNNEVVLYDKDLKKAIYVDVDNSEYVVFDDIGSEDISFDSAGNMLVKYSDRYTLLSLDTKKEVTINSYYKDYNNYVLRGSKTFGPHTTYVNGEKKTELNDLEIEPVVTRINGNVFPVYIKDKGYRYYDLEGNVAFSGSYYEAGLFNKDSLAIVKDDADSTYLIDSQGNQVTSKKYYDIKYIGSSYYAVYNSNGVYGIIDKNGKEVLSMEFTDNFNKHIYTIDNEKYLLVEKNGTGYLYDLESLEVIFSMEGTVELSDEGYIIVNSYNYYTLEGDAIN